MYPYFLLPVFFLFLIQNIYAHEQKIETTKDFLSYKKKWGNIVAQTTNNKNILKITNTQTNRSELETLICELSVKFIERGTYKRNHVSTGTKSLMELKKTNNDVNKLFELYKKIYNRDNEVKRLEKNTNKVFIESFDNNLEENTLKDMLENLEYNFKLTKVLMKGLLPYMTCKIKGGGAFGGWLFGGGVVAHKIKCESPLGQRLVFAKVDLSLGFGLGAIMTKRKRDRGDAPPINIPLRHLYKKNAKIVFSNAAAIILGAQLSNSFVGETRGLGFGLYYGAGVRKIKKTQTVCPNLEKLNNIIKLLKNKQQMK